MYKLTGQFQVDTNKLSGLEIQHSSSTTNLAIFKSGKLSSNERLYFSLLSSPLLSSVSFTTNTKLLTQGQELSCAYLVVKGDLLAIQKDKVQRLGPGSVLGLAEGLSGLPSNKTIMAVSPVQARVIPLHKVDSLLPKLPLIMRKIILTTANRTLGVTDEPKACAGANFHNQQFQPGEMIFSIEDQADRLFFIETGSVSMIDAAGQAFALIGPGHAFGEQAFLRGGIRAATARAQTAVTCLCVDAGIAHEMLADVSPLLVPIFEALLLQQSMNNALKLPAQ